MAHIKALLLDRCDLSHEEAELMRLLCEGHSLWECARLMHIQHRVLNVLFDNVCRKLGVLSCDNPVLFVALVAIATDMCSVQRVES